MFIELLIILIGTLLIWDFVQTYRPKQIFKKNGLKGPLDLPVIGATLHFVQQTPQNVFQIQANNLQEYGKTYGLRLLQDFVILTSDVRQIEAILSSQQVITKNQLYDILEVWLGRGLLMSTGQKWHSRRKIITPTFHFKILEQFVEVFDQQSSVLIEKLQDKADGKTPINICPIICLAALDVIAETAMGVKINAQMEPDFPYVKSVTTVADITALRFLHPLKRFDWFFKVFSPKAAASMKHHIESMHKFTDKIIEERRDTLEKSIKDGTYKSLEETEDLGSKRRLALLDVLLQSTISGSPLSNYDIREEVDTFMFEGHDTTTSSISFTLYLLSRHPEIQQKALEEIREVIGDDKTKPVTMRDLQNLKYLECIIKESLRLYPSVPFIGRYVTDEITLNGITYPAKTNIILLFYHAMRDPDNFPEPEKFKPERFTTEDSIKLDPFAYTPFSAGPRNCIGQKFAMLEMKSLISKVLRHYELLPLGEEVKPMMSMVLRSVNGIHLGFKSRN